MIELKKTENGYILPVLVVPGAGRSRIYGEHDGRLKLSVAAPAEKGKANREVRRFLSRELGLRQCDVQILSGHTSRRKEVLLERASPRTLEAIIV